MPPNPPAVSRSGPGRPSLASAALGSGAYLLSACLVTEKVDYYSPNVPAQVEKLAPEDFDTVPNMPECSDKDTGPNTPWVRFQIDVSDRDVEDELLARVIVNGKSVTTEDLPVTGRPKRDTFSYCVQRQRLDAACLHVEILVSNKFVDNQGDRQPYLTADPNDVGRVEWWLLGQSENYPEVGPSACQDTQ